MNVQAGEAANLKQAYRHKRALIGVHNDTQQLVFNFSATKNTPA